MDAIIDDDVRDTTCGTAGTGGAWLGPLTLANASCEDCSNLLFRVRRGKVVGEIREGGVAAGEPLLACYKQPDVTTCCKCKRSF